MSTQKHASLRQELSNQAFHRHLAVPGPGEENKYYGLPRRPRTFVCVRSLVKWRSLSSFQLFVVITSSRIVLVSFSVKSVNWGKFTEPLIDVLADKPHPRFGMKFLGKKVRLIRRCLRYYYLKYSFL